MAIATKNFSLFFCIGFWFLSSPALIGQVRFELSFEEPGSDSPTEQSALFSPSALRANRSHSSNFEISGTDNPSPTGGNYLSLNGLDQYVNLPVDPATQLTGNVAYTFSTWIYVASETSSGEIINGDDGFISGFRFYLDNNCPKLELREGQKETFSSDFHIPANRWSHIGYYCDALSDSVVFYVNGIPTQSYAFTRVSQVHTGDHTTVGALINSSQPNFLKARLDDVRFFAGRDTLFSSINAATDKSAAKYGRKSKPATPSYFALYQNYPNPFNLATTIRFELKRLGYVELQVFDLLGNNVKVIHAGELGPNVYDFMWDGTDNNMQVVSSGIYFARLSFNGAIQTKKMVLVK